MAGLEKPKKRRKVGSAFCSCVSEIKETCNNSFVDRSTPTSYISLTVQQPVNHKVRLWTRRFALKLTVIGAKEIKTNLFVRAKPQALFLG